MGNELEMHLRGELVVLEDSRYCSSSMFNQIQDCSGYLATEGCPDIKDRPSP